MAVTESRKKCRVHYIRFSARNVVRPVCKPVQAESEIAYAERRVKPLTRLLRCATALRVTAPLGVGSRRLVWPKGPLSARPRPRVVKRKEQNDYPPLA